MGADLPTKARAYVYRNPDDGSWRIDGGAPLDPEMRLLEDDGRDLLAELGLPKEWPALEAMAAPRGLSPRRVHMILGDESPTRFAGGLRLRPQEWSFDTGGQFLTLAHLPLVIGVFEWILPGPLRRLAPGARLDDASGGLDLPLEEAEAPPGVTGTFVAQLYDSPLADAGWRGVEQGILTHVSAVLVRPPGAPLGAGELVEAGLIHLPACPGAKVLRWWEQPASRSSVVGRAFDGR